ncbi:MAG: nucleoside phosphorylase [Mogibacterium sp.]|nr:nucleoside phosphorylase [Mogibacterium sp.]
MMNEFYDPETKPLFTPEDFYGPKRDCADICIVIFSRRIYAHMLERFDCVKCGEMTGCNMFTPIQVFEYNGRRIAFYLSAIGSAIASHQVIEANWLTGAEIFIMFGSAGTLDSKRTAGRYVVPSMAYRGEGMSFYYAEPSDYIKISGADKVAKCFEDAGIPYVTGPVWTTDAFYRETERLVTDRKSEGCLAVDMELAGVQAVCEHYGWRLYDFLETGDVVEVGGYDISTLSEANHDVHKLEAAFAIINKL